MKWCNPTPEQLREWDRWVADRPEHVRSVAERFNPWTLYRLTTTGQRCSVIGFHEVDVEKAKQSDPSGCGIAPVPVTAYIHAENPTLGEITGVNVFGIDPDNLVPWTEADEPAGVRMASSFGTERWP